MGLATAIGGNLFGQQALQPALEERIDDEHQRRLVADAAWRKFGWMNLAAHGVFAATWFFGRSMLSGREVSGRSRTMTIVKDGLVVASLITGIGSVVLGRMLGKMVREQQLVTSSERDRSIEKMRKLVRVAGALNLVSTVSIAAVTKGLAMEASRSVPFSLRSRRLP